MKSTASSSRLPAGEIWVDDRQRRLIEVYASHKSRCLLEESLADFTQAAWDIIEPGTKLIWNWHLDTICGYLEAVRERKIKRLIINVPPGSMKSILTSVMYPAWTWTRYPGRRFLGVTNEQGLAIMHAGMMRLVVGYDWYQERWPIAFHRNQDEKTLFRNEAMGHRQSIGLNGNVTGKRANDLLIDDPHDARRAFSDVDIANVIRAYDQGLSNRLNDMEQDAVVLIMQRLRTNDLTGHLLGKKKEKWVHLCIAQEYEGKTFDAGEDIGRPELNDPRKKKGELMFPRRFGPEVIAREKEDKGEYGYAGQHQQRPVPLEGGIIKTKWWRIWPKEQEFPKCERVFVSWDTAFSEADMKKSAFSAYTKWGIFHNAIHQRHEILLLEAWWGRVGYDELREKAKSLAKDKSLSWQLIERKATGNSLIPDLRRARCKVRGYTPDRDKVARLFAVQPMIQSGQVWIPDRKWAQAVIQQIAAAPNGAPPSADIADTMTQALIYVRDGLWVTHPDDDEKPLPIINDDDDFKRKTTQTMRGLYG